jgi:RimJ/RimL family protein N-acetyltransferase
MVALTPLKEADYEHIAGWLCDGKNAPWLDFGVSTREINPLLISILDKREQHLLRLFSREGGSTPIGVVALSDIHPIFRTGSLWFVLGEKEYQSLGYTTRAVSALLSHAFTHLKLRSVFAWAVTSNIPSIRVLEKNQFHRIGVRRECHVIEGKAYDRWLFDLLADEFEGIRDG